MAKLLGYDHATDLITILFYGTHGGYMERCLRFYWPFATNATARTFIGVSKQSKLSLQPFR